MNVIVISGYSFETLIDTEFDIKIADITIVHFLQRQKEAHTQRSEKWTILLSCYLLVTVDPK